MSYKIEALLPDREDEYQHFVQKKETGQVFASIHYRNLLRKSIQGKDNYLIALKKNIIVGVMPTFIYQSSRLGAVINALPFFGSHGQAMTKDHDPNIEKALIEAFNKLAEQHKCVSSTIVTSPFALNTNSYEENSRYRYKRSPASQIALLPDNSEENASNLMRQFHKKTRNMVRKAIKEGVTFELTNDSNSMQFLYKIHRENMLQIGAPPKPQEFFEALLSKQENGIDFNVLIGKIGQKRVAALLLLYFNRTVEYFTPAVINEYRNLQPLSLLIFEGMKNAIKRGYKYWNFGGTWPSQESIYRFKHRWGTEDYVYHYFTRILDERILKYSIEEIKSEFKYYYVLPFDELLGKRN